MSRFTDELTFNTTNTFTPVDVSSIGTSTNQDTYDNLIRPSFTNIIGTGTLDDGGYVGRLMQLIRVHITDMLENQELTKEVSGEVLSALLGKAITESIEFEKHQLLSATAFAKSVAELEVLKQEVLSSTAKSKQDIYTFTDLMPVQKVLLEEQANVEHFKHLTEEQQAIDLNIKAGGTGTLSGGITLEKSLAYIERMVGETKLGNTGNGIDLTNSQEYWRSVAIKSDAVLKNIEAGGTGDATDPLVPTSSLPYIKRMIEESKLGNTGNGIDLTNSLGKWQTISAKETSKLVEAQKDAAILKAKELSIINGGTGNNDIDPSKSIHAYERDMVNYKMLGEKEKAGYISGNYNPNLSLYAQQVKSMKEQTSMYSRQRKAFDDRKSQTLLDSAMKYNMMVFPDNTDAQNQIPDAAKKASLDSLFTSIKNS